MALSHQDIQEHQNFLNIYSSLSFKQDEPVINTVDEVGSIYRTSVLMCYSCQSLSV